MSNKIFWNSTSPLEKKQPLFYNHLSLQVPTYMSPPLRNLLTLQIS